MGISIKAKTESDIYKDKLLNKYFNKTELIDFNLMINFVDSIVFKLTNEKEIDLAYHQYFDTLNQRLDCCELGIDQNEKYRFLFKLNSDLIEKIWRLESSTKEVRTKDTILYDLIDFPYIELNAMGNYLKYLQDLGKEDPFFKELSEIITVTGDMPPSVIAGFLHDNKKFDFSKMEYRLWGVIFILTLERSVENKVEIYLNQ